MPILYRPSSGCMHRKDASKTSWYSFVPYQTNFGALCGFADDTVAGGVGFPMHSHADMEISTIVTSGAQLHRNSTGGDQLVTPESVQTMSAGTGIRHSEMNASATEPFRSYQIWVYPKRLDTAPRYGTFSFEPKQKLNTCLLTLSPDQRDGSALIGQDAFFSLSTLEAGRSLHYSPYIKGNGTYIHCVAGEVDVNGQTLEAGDAVGLHDIDHIKTSAIESSELILVEVPLERGIKV
jgi:quercetin 2,3-dioxygenase